MPPTATVVITTKNRRDDLRVAIASAVAQDAAPQVLVVDDGSTDGTAEMVRAEFPTVTLHREEQSRGYIVQRNRGAGLATGDVVFSIDDDAAFSTPRVVGQTLAEFGHPRVGAVAIPFVNVNKENAVRQRAADDGPAIACVSEYIGTAHAVRRDLFLRLSGYRPVLFHQGEERDYCLRMIDAGRVVRLGRADVIHHFESPKRDTRRMDLYGRRNDVLFAWHNAPLMSLPTLLAGTTARGLVFGATVGRPARMAHGLGLGYAAAAAELFRRRPVSRRAYRAYRLLRRHPLSLEQIGPLLPPMRNLGEASGTE